MGNSRRVVWCSVPIFLAFLSCAPGQQRDTTWSIIVEGGVGYGLSKDPEEERISRYGLSALIRIMFKPDHRLRAGIESGWLHLAGLSDETITSEFGEMSLQASLKALPVMVVFDMDIWSMNLYTGLGYYRVISTLGEEIDERSNARWMVGFYLAAVYKYRFSDKYTLAGQLRWCSIGEFGKTILLAEVFLAIPLVTW